MNTKYLLLIFCLLGFSSLVFAGIDISFEQVNAAGAIVPQVKDNRVLAENNYGCTMILYAKENIKSRGGLLAVLGIFGSPYEGSVEDLNSLGDDPLYFHNLYRIVYQGARCDCTVTVYQGTNGAGNSKDYFSKTAVSSSQQTKIDLDYCFANKAESLSVKCSAK